MTDPYVPDELLSPLIGERMYSVEFVLNDYVQVRFEGTPGVGSPVIRSCFVWPVVEAEAGSWREADQGYADALRRLTPGTVLSTTEGIGEGIRIGLDTGALVINPTAEEVFVERGVRNELVTGSV